MKRWLLLFVFVLSSCIQEEVTPEGALKTFTDARLGKVVTRQFILERVTGKMLQSLEHMSEEDFQKFSDLRNVKKDSFKVLSKSCQEKRCFLTYSISFNTKNEAAFNSEVKKIAEVLLVEGKWLIADVSNVKTYHEAMDPISPLE